MLGEMNGYLKEIKNLQYDIRRTTRTNAKTKTRFN